MRPDCSRPVIPKKKKNKKNGKENKNKSKQSDNTKYVLTTLLTEAKAPDVPLLHYLRSLFSEKTKRLKKGGWWSSSIMYFTRQSAVCTL